jgi:hypothetical protein
LRFILSVVLRLVARGAVIAGLHFARRLFFISRQVHHPLLFRFRVRRALFAVRLNFRDGVKDQVQAKMICAIFRTRTA